MCITSTYNVLYGHTTDRYRYRCRYRCRYHRYRSGAGTGIGTGPCTSRTWTDAPLSGSGEKKGHERENMHYVRRHTQPLLHLAVAILCYRVHAQEEELFQTLDKV